MLKSMGNQVPGRCTCLETCGEKNTGADGRVWRVKFKSHLHKTWGDAILFNNLTGMVVARQIRVYFEELKAEGE